MPIQLTTAYTPGDNDPGKTYAQVKITSYSVDIIDKSMRVFCQYGNTVDNVWNRGDGANHKNHIIAGQDFLDICSKLSEEEETVYETVSRVLYEYLLDNELYSGIIV